MDVLKGLGALTAFAGTMLILSVVVSTLVETIHRVWGLREKGLALMLTRLYRETIAPLLAGGAAKERDFVERMTCNRAPTGDVGMPIGRSGSPSADIHFLSWIWGGRRLGDLTVHGFMERLGSSEFGDAVMAKVGGAGSAAADVVLKDLAVKFEAFGEEAGTYFEARSRLLSVLVALAVAWQCNVNPYDIGMAFMQNPSVADAVTQRAKALLEKQDADKSEVAAKAVVAAKGDDASKQALDESKQALDKVTQQLDDLRSDGVPIGWTPERLSSRAFRRSTCIGVVYPASRAGIPTAGWLLLGGLLVGLGGPFWSKTFSMLLDMRDQAAALQPPPPTGSAASSADTATTAAAHFKIASEARGILLGDGRGVLTSDGDAAVG